MIEATIFFPLLLLYALVITIAGWFVLDTERKQRMRQGLVKLKYGISFVLDGAFFKASKKASQSQFEFRNTLAFYCQLLGNHRWRIIATAAILVTPVIFVVLLNSSPALDGYVEQKETSDPVIIALLRGEQLVPPAPLPPELFSTKEIEAERQGLAGASREWMMLNTDFRQRLLTVFKLMEKHGYQMALIEGYRSPERQTYLTTLNTRVTNVGAYQSFHQYGLAADSAFFRDGKVIISEKDPWAMEGYKLYGQYAESVGLTWGGRWKLMDFGHVELKKPGVLGNHER